MKRRLLSLLLAVAMLATMVVTIPVAAIDVGDEFYNFKIVNNGEETVDEVDFYKYTLTFTHNPQVTANTTYLLIYDASNWEEYFGESLDSYTLANVMSALNDGDLESAGYPLYYNTYESTDVTDTMSVNFSMAKSKCTEDLNGNTIDGTAIYAIVGSDNGTCDNSDPIAINGDGTVAVAQGTVEFNMGANGSMVDSEGNTVTSVSVAAGTVTLEVINAALKTAVYSVKANDGYTFKGWSESADGAVIDSSWTKELAEGDSLTLYAVYGAKTEVSAEFTVPDAKTYDGSAATAATVSVKDGESNPIDSANYTVVYVDSESNELTDPPTNAGEYTVKVKLTDTDNYTFADGTAEATADTKLTINKATLTLNTDNVSTTKTYDGATTVYNTSGNELTSTDLSLSGVVEADKDNVSLTGTLSAAYDSANVVGVSKITISGLTLTGDAAGNYSLAESTEITAGVTITAKEITLTVTPKTDLTYTGTAYEAKNTVEVSTADGDIISGDIVTYTYTVENDATILNAGEYKVTVELDDSVTNYTAAPVDATVKIANSTSTLVTAPTGATGLVYDGTEKTLVSGGSATNGTLQYVVGTNATDAPESGWSETVPTETNAGTYYVWYKVVGDTNYDDTTPQVITVSIAEADSSATVTAAQDLTYNGSPQELVTGGSATGGTLKYAVSTDSTTEPTEWSETVPTKTDAGTYYVWYKVEGDANHNDSDAKTVEVKISPKTITLTATPVGNLTYNGSTYEAKDTVDVSVGDLIGNDTVTYTYTVADGKEIKDAGTYTVTVALADSVTNYTATEQSATVTVAQANSSVTAPTANTPLTYNGSPQTLVTGGSATGGQLQYSTDGTNYSTAVPTGIDAKTYTVYYKVVGDANHNDSEPATVAVTISPANYDYTAGTVTTSIKEGTTLTDGKVTIDNSTAKIIKNVSGEVVAGTITITGVNSPASANQSGLSWSFEPAVADSNYNPASGNDATVTVTLKTVVTAPTIASKPYTGTTLTANVQETDDYTVTENDGGVNVGDYNVKLTLKDPTNKKWSTSDDAEITLTFSITQADNSWTTEPSVENVTYPTAINPNMGTATFGTASVKYVGTGDTEYAESETAPTNAGTYKATFTVAETTNYKGLTKEDTFTISKATQEISSPSAASTTQTSVTLEAIAAGHGTTQYAKSTSDIAPTNDSDWQTSTEFTGLAQDTTYYFFARFTGDNNYEAATSTGAEIKTSAHEHVWKYTANGNVITATCEGAGTCDENNSGGTLTLNAPTTDLTYNGSAHDATVESTLVTGVTVPNIAYTYSATADGTYATATDTIAAGYYKASVTVGEATATVSYQIAKAASSATEPTGATDLVYDGTAQKLVTGGSATGGQLQYSTDGTNYSTAVPTGIDAKTYTVYYKVVGDANHNDSEPATIAVTISPADYDYTAGTVTTSIQEGATVTDNKVTIDNSTAQIIKNVKGEVVAGTITIMGVNSPASADQSGLSWTFEPAVADSNYNPASGTDATVTVTSKTVVTAPTIASKEYTGTTLTADVQETADYTVTENNGGTDVGNYNVKLTLTDPTNKKWSTSDDAEITLTFSITQADNLWTTDPSVEDVTYPTAINPNMGEAKFGTASVKYVGTGDTEYAESETAPTNAGTYKATFTVAETTNYKGLTKEVGFTISKATPEYTAPTGLTATYGQTLSDIELPSGFAWSDSSASVGDAGTNTFTVTYTPTDTTNYNTVTDISVTVTVNKADSSATAPTAAQDLTYNGSPLTLVTGGEATGGELQYSTDGTNYSTAIPTGIDAETYTVYYKVVGDANHNDSEPATVEVIISPASYNVGTVTTSIKEGTTLTDGKVTIDNSTAQIIKNVNNEVVAGTITITGVTSPASANQSGLSWTFEPAVADSNYNPASGTDATVTVTSKTVVTAPTIASKTYTGTTLTADVEESTLYTVTENNGGTDVGNYNVKLTLTDPTNKKWSTSDDAEITLTFSITQAGNSWTTEPSVDDVTYPTAINPNMGEAKFGTASVKYVGTGDTEYAESETAPTNAGTYKATFTVAETNNYKGLTKEVEFTISEEAPPAEEPTATPTDAPTATPTDAPTAPPTDAPTATPIDAPTEAPTIAPTDAPTVAPTEAPTAAPTDAPTEAPTAAPTDAPTAAPTDAPTAAPTDAPTAAPTDAPTAAPTDAPTAAPTVAPTDAPTEAPTVEPSATPTAEPSATPTGTIRTIKGKKTTHGTYDLIIGGETISVSTDDYTIEIPEGTTVEIVPHNYSGYKVSTVKYGTTTIKADEDGRYFLTVPESDVEVAVTFKSTSGGGSGGNSGGSTGGGSTTSTTTPTATPNPDATAEPGTTAEPNATTAPVQPGITGPAGVHEAYVNGYPDGEFKPENGITRAEAAAIFARALTDYSEGSTYTGSFTDVAQDWYTNYVNFLAGRNVIAGYDDGTFRPDDNITRREFTAMITRLGVVIGATDGAGFPDVSDTDWAADNIYTASVNGLVSGYSDGTFRPDNDITRAEAVKIVNAYLGRGTDAAGIANADYTTFPDVTPDYWAYYEIIEAANPHNYNVGTLPEVWYN